ncbi:MAG: MBL fold metallo-hydrolase [Armatimonadota bacterium]|nr:MBL fold metallo-hydrolase [Armatimonadota bacterium]
MPVVRVEPDVFCVRMPIPFPLGSVNAYLVRTDDGVVLVDAGLRTPDCFAALQEALETAGVSLSGLRAVVLTHAHPDHIGLAGVLQGRTGVPLYLLDVEEPLARRVWVNDHAGRVRAITQMLRAHGVPEKWVEEAGRQVAALRELVAPFGPVRTLGDGQLLELDGFSAHVLWTPGHSDGHMVLLDPRGRLFCGDHVLPEVSPNISLYPGARPNPLADYLDSLRKVRDLPVRVALPGHGDPITDWAARVDQLLEHHRMRLDAAYDLVPPEGVTAFQLAQRLFFEGSGDGVGPPEIPLPLAVGEAAAHLEWLYREGRLVREEGPPVVYRPAEAST